MDILIPLWWACLPIAALIFFCEHKWGRASQETFTWGGLALTIFSILTSFGFVIYYFFCEFPKKKFWSQPVRNKK